jgi:hypothetical protein
LLSSITSLEAVLLAAFVLMKQNRLGTVADRDYLDLQVTAHLEKDRHLRDERAAKAVLSLALSELTQYSIDCINLLEPYVPSSGPSPQVPPDMTAPRIPDAILEPMQASARFARTLVCRPNPANTWLATDTTLAFREFNPASQTTSV